MPVRFRCKHCQQLLGIARRKIGTEVRCPECNKMVLVPAEDAPEIDDLTRKRDSPVEGGKAGLNLQPAAVGAAEEQAAPVFLPPAPAPFDVDVYRIPDPVPGPGMNLSPLLAVLLTIGAVLILALAFTVGLLVGRYVL